MALPFGYQPTPIYYSLLTLFRLLSHFLCLISQFLYVLSARVYRTELTRLMRKLRQHRFHTRIQPSEPTNRNRTNRIEAHQRYH